VRQLSLAERRLLEAGIRRARLIFADGEQSYLKTSFNRAN
jgi:hypothetical protein